MTGFEFPDRERFTALFASSISFPDREESPHVRGVGRITPSFLKYLYNSCTPEEKVRIGKYAADNGATKAATHFSKLTDSKAYNSASAHHSQPTKPLHTDPRCLRFLDRVQLFPNSWIPNSLENMTALNTAFYLKRLHFLISASLSCTLCA